MAEKKKYRTVSLLTGLTDDVEKLIEERPYWPGVSAFVREATMEKLKAERRNIRESMGAKERSEKDEAT